MSDHSAEPVLSPRVYTTVFAALVVLTLLSVGLAHVDLGYGATAAVLGIALLQALLITLYFMHVRYSGALIVLVIAGTLVWLLILFVLTMADYLSRPWSATQGW